MPTESLTRKEVQQELYECYRAFYGSITRGIAGMFSEKKLIRIGYRHLASKFILRKLRRLV